MVFSPMRLPPATAVNTAVLRLSCPFCHGVPVLSAMTILRRSGFTTSSVTVSVIRSPSS